MIDLLLAFWGSSTLIFVVTVAIPSKGSEGSLSPTYPPVFVAGYVYLWHYYWGEIKSQSYFDLCFPNFEG